MNHADHVNLLRKGIPGPGGVWADLGSGTGAFTLALAELLGPSGQIYSLDKDRRALRRQAKLMQTRFPDTLVSHVAADFTNPLDLPLLDGVVMANALHFLPRQAQEKTVRLIRGTLRPNGHFILVEYDTDRGNHWVPYPLSFQSWNELASRAGFAGATLLAARPSRFLGRIYSAASVK